MDQEQLTIIGLGNGDNYSDTLHSIGRDMVYLLGDKYGYAEEWGLKGSAKFKKGEINGHDVLFLISEGWMNSTGEDLKDFLICKNILLIQDEIAVPFGEVKLSHNKNSAGHNGVRSVIEALGDKNFMRIRVGIGGKANSLYDLVYMKMTEESKQILGELFENKIDPVIQCLATEGLEKATQLCNTKPIAMQTAG